MVINKTASRASGDLNITRHNEVEILDIIRTPDNGKACSRTNSLMPFQLLVPRKQEFDWPITLLFGDRGGVITRGLVDISMM